MKSFAVQGTVFWLLVTAIFGAAAVFYRDPRGGEFFTLGTEVALIDIPIAFFCWKLHRWSFIAAGVSALLLLAGFTGFPLASRGDVLVVLVQLQVILFTYRAFREVRGVDSSRKPV